MTWFQKSPYPPHLNDEPSIGRGVVSFVWEVVKIIVISLAIIIPVRYFLIKPFYVKGASMEPNFYDHQYLIIDEMTYRIHQPERGDIVVFRYPNDPRQYFIKRVIGLPGETIKIVNGQIIVINTEHPSGEVLEESYLSPTLTTNGIIDVTLAQDEYYLLGDNRAASLDSRFFGPVNRSYIVGRTLWRGWPIEKVGFVLGSHQYNL